MFDAYTPSEVALRLPVDVTCLAYQGSSRSVLAGGKVGHLYVFTSARNRNVYEYTNMCKNFERKAVFELCVCEREEILLCVSDGQLVAHRLNDAEFTVETLLHKVKNVATFVKFVPKGSDTLYIVVSARRKLHLFKWGELDGNKEFVEVQFDYDLVLSDTPSYMKCVNECIFFCTRDEYFILTMQKKMVEEKCEFWNGNVRKLLSFQTMPGIVPMVDRGIVGFVRNETVVTTNLAGVKSVDEFKFSEPPIQIVYDAPYLVALLSKGRVEIRSSYDSSLIQTMCINKALFLCNGHRGKVFIGARTDIWVLDSSINLRKNVSHLINERRFDLAIQLVDGSNLFTEENKMEIKRQAALNLFEQKKFDESFALFTEIRADVITIIQMFPELLPEGIKRNPAAAADLPANEKKRAMLALGYYLSAVRTDFAKKIEHLRKEAVKNKEELNKQIMTLRVVDTTLLRCYIKTKPALVDSLIRLHNNACTFDDAETILKNENLTKSLFILYESRKKHELALDLLIQQSSKEEKDAFFENSLEMIIEYLQSLGNSNLQLIFRYSKWVLAKDLTAGVGIFIGDETEMAKNLDRRAIVQFMKNECVAAIIPYLEHLIYEWNETDSYFHETLLEYYVAKVNWLFKDYVHAFPDDQNITRAGEEEGDLGVYRKKLLRFLRYSQVYSPQTVLLQLAPHAFYEERAVIFGRLKQHDHALLIYISVLKNIEAAEEYCDLYYNPTDEINSQVYLQLFRALVSSPMNDRVVTSFGSFVDEQEDGETNFADVNAAIKILTKHADKIPTVPALNMLPDETPLRIVASALNAVLQTTNDVANERSLQKCVLECSLKKKEAKKNAAESTKIVINLSSECVVCLKKIGVSAFVRYPDSSLAHFYCYNDKNQRRM